MVAAAACALPAAEASATKPVVPVFIQQLALKKAATVAYAPTRMTFAYRYTGYTWLAASRQLTFRFDDRRFPRTGKHALRFTAEPFKGTLATCSAGKQKTLQLDGNKVYWDGSLAWRCVRGGDGRLVKLLASGPNLPDAALGIVVASGKRIAP
jgi:hypothetical protein